MTNTPRAELRLLLYCARMYLEAREANQIKSLVSKNIEWTYLVRIARTHAVMPLLYRTLNSICSDTVPKETLEELREHFYANAGRNLFLTKELLKLLHRFEVEGLPAIPYKGPVLAASVYGNLALRDFGDLDILVHERNYERAQQLLMGQGFRLVKEFDWESTLIDGSGRVAVDLHKRLTPREFPSPLNFEYLSGSLQRIILVGTEVPNLAPEDILLMLAIQITKDIGTSYFQLAKICDIAELLRAYPRLDLVQAVKQAKRLGGERMLLFSLGLTNNLVGAALSQEVVCKMRCYPSLDGLVEYARQQFFYASDRPGGDHQRIDQFRWVLRERLRDRLYPYYLRYVTGVILPCDLDRRLLPLPRHLSFLYYFIRAIRLVGKYVLHPLMRPLDRARLRSVS